MRGRIDHAAEARKRIVWGEEWMEREGDTDVTNTVVALHAQVHATLALAEQQRIAILALVEQQRIANLIALGILVEDEVPETGERGLLYRQPDDVQSCPDIAAALGIGDDDE